MEKLVSKNQFQINHASHLNFATCETHFLFKGKFLPNFQLPKGCSNSAIKRNVDIDILEIMVVSLLFFLTNWKSIMSSLGETNSTNQVYLDNNCGWFGQLLVLSYCGGNESAMWSFCKLEFLNLSSIMLKTDQTYFRNFAFSKF